MFSDPGLYGLLRLVGADLSDPEVQNYVEWLAASESPGIERRYLIVSAVRRLVRVRSRLRAAGRRLASVRRTARPRAVVPAADAPRWSAPPYLFAPEDAKDLAAQARSRFPLEVEAVLACADRLRAGVIPLLGGHEVTVRDAESWRPALADREQLFFLNRCQWAPVLARAALYTGEAACVQGLVRLLRSWGESNPIGQPDTWESYSVADRICNWTLTAYLLRAVGGADDFLAEWLLPQLTSHATYLADHLETALRHNHLINDGRALFTFGLCFPGLPGAARARDLGWAILAEEMPRQTRPDGVFREQSTHYHLLLTRTFTEAIQLARHHRHPVHEAMLGLLERMHEAAAAMLRPDGTIAYVGDICPDVEAGSLRGVLAAGAVLFGRSDLKRPEAINEASLWMLGADGLRAWDALAPGAPERAAVAFPHGGFAIAGRRGPASAHAALHCDPAGAVLFHGDPDPLGVTVWLAGREVLVDTGNVSYARDRWWTYFKSPAAQNTIVVDGLLPWPDAAHRQWFGPRYGGVKAGVEAGVAPGGEPVLEGWHSGYCRLPDPVTLHRQVAVGDQGIVITDWLDGAGTHRAEIFFHLGPGQAAVSGSLVHLLDERGEVIATVDARSSARLTIALVEGWAATGYGVKRPAQAVRVSLCERFPVTVETAIVAVRPVADALGAPR